MCTAAIKEGAEELLSEKRVVSGAVNIRTNREKMKVHLIVCPTCSCLRREAAEYIRWAHCCIQA